MAWRSVDHYASLHSSSTMSSFGVNRVWKRYRSVQLGFSLDYPADSFVPQDGASLGEPDAVSFIARDFTPSKIANGKGSSIEVRVDPAPTEDLRSYRDTTVPLFNTYLAGHPATRQDQGACPIPSCDVRFLMINRGNIYELNIYNGDVNGADYVSPADIELIQKSFRLD